MIVALTRSLMQDRVRRLPIVLFNLFWLGWELRGLRRLFAAVPPLQQDQPSFVLTVTARVVLIVFLATLTLLHALRHPPKAGYATLAPRLDAILGLGLGYFTLLLTRAPSSPGWDLLSVLLLVSGNLFSILAALDLGRSLSILPEARVLVTHGIYRVIRHPLYLGEGVAFLGVLAAFRSWPALALLALQFLFQWRRMRWEEGVLSAQFSDYPAYRARTAALLPGVY